MVKTVTKVVAVLRDRDGTYFRIGDKVKLRQHGVLHTERPPAGTIKRFRQKQGVMFANVEDKDGYIYSYPIDAWEEG